MKIISIQQVEKGWKQTTAKNDTILVSQMMVITVVFFIRMWTHSNAFVSQKRDKVKNYQFVYVCECENEWINKKNKR